MILRRLQLQNDHCIKMCLPRRSWDAAYLPSLVFGAVWVAVFEVEKFRFVAHRRGFDAKAWGVAPVMPERNSKSKE